MQLNVKLLHDLHEVIYRRDKRVFEYSQYILCLFHSLYTRIFTLILLNFLNGKIHLPFFLTAHYHIKIRT